MLEAVSDSVRAVLVAAALLFLPGYLLTTALLPPGRLGVVNRLYLASLGSVFLSSLIGFILAVPGPGLTRSSLILTWVCVVAVLAIVAGVRSARGRTFSRPARVVTRRLPLPAASPDKWLLAAGSLVVALVLFASVDAFNGTGSTPAEEFYFTRSPSMTSAGTGSRHSARVLVPITLTNRTDRSRPIRLVLRLAGRPLRRRVTVAVPGGHSVRRVMSATVLGEPLPSHLSVSFYRPGSAAALAELKYWLRLRPPAPQPSRE